MKVVKGSDGSYALTGMSENDVRALGALADFPVWAWQPPAVAGFCNAAHDAAQDAVGEHLGAEKAGMIGVTTVE